MPAYLAAALFGILCFLTLTAAYLLVVSVRSADADGIARAPDAAVSRLGRRVEERLARANVDLGAGPFLVLVVIGSVLLGGAFVMVPPHHPAQLVLGVACGVLAARWIT